MSPNPNKPIEKAIVIFKGDPSVGIPRTTFHVELWIDLKTMDQRHWKNTLAVIRNRITRLYDYMLGETPEVLFDFELEALAEQEKKLEESSTVNKKTLDN